MRERESDAFLRVCLKETVGNLFTFRTWCAILKTAYLQIICLYDKILRKAGETVQKVILTGATGSIGLALLENLIQKNIQITVLLNPNSKRNASIKSHPLITAVPCDVHDYAGSVLPDTAYDCFFHLAWQGTTGADRNNAQLQKENYDAALCAIRLAKKLGCKKFIGIGSQAEFGRKDIPLSPQLPCSPETWYGKYKYQSGIDGKALANTLGIQFNWVRIASVFGLAKGESSLPSYVIRVLTNGEEPKFTPSNQIWDFLYADDAAKALLLIAQKGIDGKTYVLGSGEGKPLKSYIQRIYDIVSPGIVPIFGETEYAKDQLMYLVTDISELTKDTGFVPQFTFESAVQDIIKRTRGYIK